MPAPRPTAAARPPLAHSDRGRGAQTYADHAGRVGPASERHAAVLARFGGAPGWFAKAVGDARRSSDE